MRRALLLFLILAGVTYAGESPKMIHALAVNISYTDAEGQEVQSVIARDMDAGCRKLPFNGETYWSGDYPKVGVPDVCKKSFITTAGKLAPMQMHPEIETFGELEVLDFIEEMQEDKNMLLVDSRRPNWYESGTIPSAINIPFIYFKEKGKWEKKKHKALKLLGVTKNMVGYDFSRAKTVLFFCNGIWCRQSPIMIEILLEMGYPPKKMKWYRGGMQSWLSVGMTSTHNMRVLNK